MDNKRAEELLEKYLEGRCTPEESVMIESWYNQTSETVQDLSEAPDYKRAHLLLSKNLPLAGNLILNPKPVIRLWTRIATAAAIFLIMGAGFYFYVKQSTIPDTDRVSYKNDINPGGNKAVLTLANGEIIDLSNTKTGVVIDAGELTSVVRYASGSQSSGPLKSEQSTTGPVSIRSLPGKEQLTVRTPRGGTYQIVLSDGTKVWLNAASSLKFPASFKGKNERIVELNGEGYFEVNKAYASLPVIGQANIASTVRDNKGARIPFVVVSKGQKVEVLGTHFNISSYDDESSSSTTLLEGSVRINQQTILKPGMQAVLNQSGQIKVQNLTDPEEAISWQTGYFTFKRENLDEIMRQVSRWYDVDVLYKNEEIKSIPFSGSITRFGKVSELLKMLELTGKVKFRIEGKDIIAERK